MKKLKRWWKQLKCRYIHKKKFYKFKAFDYNRLLTSDEYEALIKYECDKCGVEWQMLASFESFVKPEMMKTVMKQMVMDE